MKHAPLACLACPIRTDAANAFAHYSMRQRVPAIARDVLAHNPHLPDAVEQLARDIEANALIPRPRPPAPDVDAWADAYASHPGERWLAAEWFYAEFAFYRELARACRYWETGRDPFAWTKEEELAGEGPWARVSAALGALHALPAREERIAALMEQSLWGNRVDLSYRVAAALTHVHAGDLLADDRAAAVPLLAGAGAGAGGRAGVGGRAGLHVHVAADNTGTELALDLALVDAVLERRDARVTIHLKMQPVFVSDATVADVWTLLDRMRARAGESDLVALSDRLRAAFEAERLAFAPDPFWSGPRFLADMPRHLREELADASVLVMKGDANYRRVVRDAMWPPQATFADACAGLPCPVVCLRTMKSDAIVGLPPDLVRQLDETEPRWRIDGKRGVVQASTSA